LRSKGNEKNKKWSEWVSEWMNEWMSELFVTLNK
jgi:hypothetical protein